MSLLQSWRPIGFRALALVAVAFGLLTLKSGGAVLFGDGAARVAAGAYVPFVLWFNFLAGFAYLAAGVGLWGRRPWAARLAAVIAVSTLAVYGLLGLHIGAGGAYETRTVIAMGIRSAVWTAIALIARRQLPAPDRWKRTAARPRRRPEPRTWT